jgi:hypothetical protein
VLTHLGSGLCHFGRKAKVAGWVASRNAPDSERFSRQGTRPGRIR